MKMKMVQILCTKVFKMVHILCSYQNGGISLKRMIAVLDSIRLL